MGIARIIQSNYSEGLLSIHVHAEDPVEDMDWWLRAGSVERKKQAETRAYFKTSVLDFVRDVLRPLGFTDGFSYSIDEEEHMYLVGALVVQGDGVWYKYRVSS